MNGGLLPLILLSATVALMLSFVPMRSLWLALPALIVAALIGFSLPISVAPRIVFTALWLSVIVAAILVYLPVSRWLPAAIPLALNAGFWLGLVAAISPNGGAVGLGLLPLLLMIPGQWLARKKFDIVIKVVASWMIAIASLSLFVSLMPTPGYEPDHME